MNEKSHKPEPQKPGKFPTTGPVKSPSPTAPKKSEPPVNPAKKSPPPKR